MNDTERKRLFVLFAVVVILLLGMVVWLFLAKKTDTTNISGTGSLVGQGSVTQSEETRLGGKIGAPMNSPGGNDLASRSRFVQLSTTPVAGATFAVSNNHTVVRYISRENGFIYDVDPSDLTTSQITNTTFEKGVVEAFWAEGGDTVVIRYADHSTPEIIKTYLGTIGEDIDGEGSPRKISGLFLQDDISAVTVSPDGTRLFYLLPTETSVSGILYDLKTQKGTGVFQNSFREWTPQFINNNELILTTKPSANVPGFSYHYNVKTSALTRFIREKNGLTVNISPDGKFAVSSGKLAGEYYTSLWSKAGYEEDGGDVFDDLALPFVSLSDKCAWPKEGAALYCAGFMPSQRMTLPDDWYQGAVVLQDLFWKADRENGETTVIGDSQLDLQSTFDSTGLVVAPDETALIFTNKTDGSLWLLNFIPYITEAQSDVNSDTGKDE